MKPGKSIMTKMVLLLAAAAIPLYAAGLMMYNVCAQQMVNEMLENKRAQMAYYIQSVQDELSRLVGLEAMVVNDSEIGSLTNRYSYFTAYERGRRVNTLHNRLVNTRLSCAYAESVTAYMGPLNKKLNDQDGLDPMTQEDADFVARLSEGPIQTIYLDDGRLYAAVQVLNGAKEPVYTLAARLSVSRLRQDLKQLESGVTSESVILYGGAQPLVATADGMDALWPAAMAEAEALSRGEAIRLRIDGERYYVTGVSSTFAKLTLLNFTRERDMMTMSWKYLPYLLVLTAAAVVLMIVLAQGTRSMVHRPLRKLIAAFQRMEDGDLTVSIEHHRQDEFREVYQSFNHMARMLDQYVNRSLKQELLLRRSEIMQLQAQINPHFLYNSYFMLHRMVKRRDWQNAERLSGYMGECFRYITRNADQLVPLEKEAEHARIYCEIQEMRFGGRIRVDFGEIPEALRALSTPRLILQPVLENAFEHGLRDTEEDGLVRVRFCRAGDGCVVTVEDNGDTLSDEGLARLCQTMDETQGETTALRNICHRLRLREGDGLAFGLSRSPLGGLCVTMTIRTKDEERGDEA